jgi:RNA polymerase sigma-70 factor (ECF subfamily)
VVMMRDVEEMDTAEPAAALTISEQNVKVRLPRPRDDARLALFARRREGPRSVSFYGRAL